MPKRNKKIRNIMTLLVWVVTITMSFTGCAGKSRTSNDTDSDSNKDSITNTEQKLTFEEIEELAENSVFNVMWYDELGSFTAGTAFLIDSDTHHEKLLVTAFHFLIPEDEDNFSGKDLPEYLQGGQIFYASSSEATGASIKNCVVIEDAAPVPKAEKDVSAFTIQSGDKLQTLPLSTHDAKKGDTVYLLADLWDTDDIHENCVYEAKITSVDKDCIYYELDSKYGTSGASGAPVINAYGEVIGIHLASNGSNRVAHRSESFIAQIDNGKISDVTYPEKTEDTSLEDEGEVFEFEREDKVSTMFYDVQMDKVRVLDSIGGMTAETGEKFLVLDVCLRANESFDEPVNMYSEDFMLMWVKREEDENNMVFPLEEALDEAQLSKDYTIDSKTDTKGTLIFSIPDDVEVVALELEDYYWIGDSEELYYGDAYLIVFPVEDWERAM